MPDGALAERAAVQADKFGATIRVPVEATALRREADHYMVDCGDGPPVAARCVVIATGARYRKLPLDRLAHFEATSVFYAATNLEAQVCGPGPIAIVGGGNSAGQAAVFLATRAEQVLLVARDADLQATMSRYLIDQISANPRIQVLVRSEVRALFGEDTLVAVEVEDDTTGQRHRIPVTALFVFIGADPCTGWLADSVALDPAGFVLTGEPAAAARPDTWPEGTPRPSMLETSAPGVYAVGDVRSGSIKRVASAVGEGSMAIRLVHAHLAQHGHAR